MQFDIEKYISPLIQSQFPAFYEAEGPNFILFVKAYYEWLEEDGNAVGEARNLFDYRDIDNTLTEFLSHFQQKYLYGIPFNVIANKRLLLKHIFDVYRSKGSLQCYKLLFRLIYNEDIDIYNPSYDIFIPSDGTWTEPKYIEVNYSPLLKSYVGQQVVGLSSGYTAVVESVVQEPINKNIVYTLNLSNIKPVKAEFIIGEKIVLANQNVSAEDIVAAPKVLGSLNSIQVINGGQGFNVGDILAIAHTDISTGNVISYGINGSVRVSSLSRGFGSINFDITSGGFGYTTNSLSFTYPYFSNSFAITANTKGFDNTLDTISIPNANTYLAVNTQVYYEVPNGNTAIAGMGANVNYYVVASNSSTVTLSSTLGGGPVNITDTRTTNPAEIHYLYIGTPIKDHQSNGVQVGANASFSVGALTYVQELSYNTDLICDYYNKQLNALTFNFPISFAGNISANLSDCLSFDTNYFGSISSLTNLNTGNNYAQQAYATAAATQLSNPLPGTVTYAPTANVVQGVGTAFTSYYSNGDVIVIRANAGFAYTEEAIVIKQVVNDNYIELWGPPTYASAPTAQYKMAPQIILSQFTSYDPVITSAVNFSKSLAAKITAAPSIGANVVSTVGPVNSGKGYVDTEFVTLYLTRGITTPTVLVGGSGYVTGDPLIITGGGTTSQARGTIIAGSNGAVVGTTLTYAGSGYTTIPFISVKSKNGKGAALTTTISEFNTLSQVTGRVTKSGTGKGQGYWSTSRSFLSADKYLQDSNYYQAFSYEIQVPLTLDKYKDILYNTFHVAGTRLFGKFSDTMVETELFVPVFESTSPEITLITDELLNNVIPDILETEDVQGDLPIQQEQN